MFRARASRAMSVVVSAFHAVLTALLTFLFPEWYESKRAYRPERHYMRGPGPKWRAKHLFDYDSARGL